MEILILSPFKHIYLFTNKLKKGILFFNRETMILVLGDAMIDRYYYSSIQRISPEAPIPIYHVESIENRLGGACNLALNLVKINKEEQIFYVWIRGDKQEDIEGNILEDLLRKENISFHAISIPNRKTTVKNRIYVQERMVSRFDIETTQSIDYHEVMKIYDIIHHMIKKYKLEGVVFSDYDKGFLTIDLCEHVIQLCNDYSIPVFVDPKPRESMKYKNCFLVKPNFQEACQISSLTSTSSINTILHSIFQTLSPQHIVMTHGSQGMYYYSNHSLEEFPHENMENHQIKDVTGCGDSVFAVMITQYLKTKNMIESIRLANYIGLLSTKCVGTYICNQEDIDSYQKKKETIKYTFEKKILHFHSNTRILQFIYQNIQKDYSKIVFTNGCFDIVHLGHIQLFQYSKSLGDFLIVAINSDASIKRLKGPKRPFHNQEYRSQFLTSFSMIDLIVIFDEDTPEKLLQFLKPHILVKGGDYTIENIKGKEFVEEVKIFPLLENYSTSRILKNHSS
jgi:D-beta-D-heptose 7-phosphate kinase/D-beta-D-heptose 1-phosphate adenosyltransferase